MACLVVFGPKASVVSEIYKTVKDGTQIVLVGRNLDDFYDELVAHYLRLNFTKIEFDFVDVSDHGKVLILVGKILEVVGRYSNKVMFLFAQGLLARKLFSLTDSRLILDQVLVNFLGPILISHEILRENRNFYHARFLFLSSCAVSLEAPGTVTYTASKKGLEGYVAVLSKEFEALKSTGFCRIIRITQIEGGLSSGLSQKDIDSLHKRFPSRFTTSGTLCQYISDLLHSRNMKLEGGDEWLIL